MLRSGQLVIIRGVEGLFLLLGRLSDFVTLCLKCLDVGSASTNLFCGRLLRRFVRVFLLSYLLSGQADLI